MVYVVPKDLEEIEQAKEKISGGDYLAAGKMLLNVQRNFPALDNISGMIAVCDILISADLGFVDVDFNFVLQIPPDATTCEIESRYNKLTSLIEPITNNFPGAASALRIVQDAYSVLLHQQKHNMFDTMRATKLESYSSGISKEKNILNSQLATENLVQIHENSSTCESWTTDSYEAGDDDGNMYERNSMEIALNMITDAEVSTYLGERQAHGSKLHTQSSSLKADDFVGEQENEIYYQEASCIDIMAEKTHDKFSTSVCLSSPGKNSSHFKNCNQDYHSFDNNRKAELCSIGQVWATYDEENIPRRYAKIIWIDEFPFRLHVSWFNPVPITAHGRKWYETNMPVLCGLFNLDGDERTPVPPTCLSHLISTHGGEQIEIYPQSGEVWAIYRDWRPLEWLSNPRARKECTLEIVEILNGYFNLADVVVKRLVKVQGFKNVFRRSANNDSDHTFAIPAKSLYRFSHRIPAYRFTGREMDGISDEMFELDHLAVPTVLEWDMRRESFCGSTLTLSHANAIPVPKQSDAEAKSLKQKWVITDFTPEKSVWAIYDGQDLMPRRYVVVNNVTSWSKVSATLLEPYPMLGEEISWLQGDLPIACGLFRCGETTLDLNLSRFSHTIKCDKVGEESLYRIYPKKGEVWAMYKNWDAKGRGAGFNGHHCLLVEIVTDFSEESGVTAVSLIEVPGWKLFFKRQLQDGSAMSLTVARKEMVCFSHQVPAYTVEGIELYGIPKGSWHVEPDALPLTVSSISSESRC